MILFYVSFLEMSAAGPSLYDLAKEGDWGTLKPLLNPDTINAVSGRGTPLSGAIMGYQDAIVEELLKMGANPNLRIGQLTPLFTACIRTTYPTLEPVIKAKVVRIIEILLANGADPRISIDRAPFTPLFLAIRSQAPELVKKLIEAGANPNFEGILLDGSTIRPLQAAFEKNDPRIINDLLEFGADKTIVPHDPRTSEIVKYLLSLTYYTKTEARYKGFKTRSEMNLLNNFFGEEKEFWSFCPVCLDVYNKPNDGSCSFVSHDCTKSKHFHKDLYGKFRMDRDGDIHWCSTCGRAAHYPAHYKLLPYDIDHKARFPQDVARFECEGGSDEKFLRFRRLREILKFMESYVGIISETAAKNIIIQETWNAPFDRSKLAEQSLGTFVIPNTAFPKELVNNEHSEIIPNPHELPIFIPSGTNSSSMEENTEVYMFQHPESGDYHHDNFASKATVENFIRSGLEDRGSAKFGRCVFYPDCRAILHPDEVREIIKNDLYEQYLRYFPFRVTSGGGRKKHTRKERKLKGGFLEMAQNIKCNLPQKKKGGHRRITRRKHRRA